VLPGIRVGLIARAGAAAGLARLLRQASDEVDTQLVSDSPKIDAAVFVVGAAAAAGVRSVHVRAGDVSIGRGSRVTGAGAV
jgi:hypothetical protein